MTAQGGSAWTVDMCGNNTRSRKAAGIEDWDRGAAPHCHFDRSEVEWRNLPVILWLVVREALINSQNRISYVFLSNATS